ncbi:MAG: inositol-3-phosphate synthase [Planctomycetota bacterium]|nr:inositol-3-phosphate synthase [Planctomycetota bacterium]
MTHNEPATGVMLVGVYGSVALCTMIGAIARRLGKTDDTGMVSTLEEFSHLSLPEPSQWVWGGWDIRNTSLIASARELHEVTGSISSQLFESVSGELEKIEKNVFRGSGYGLRELLSRFDDIELTDRNAAQSVLQMKEDIVAFRRMNSLDRVIVVNVASTEPLFEQTDAHRSLSSLDEAISSDSEGITPSILYAYAALDSGCPYINFTLLRERKFQLFARLSDQKGLPHTGRERQDGRDALKTVLRFDVRQAELQGDGVAGL